MEKNLRKKYIDIFYIEIDIMLVKRYLSAAAIPCTTQEIFSIEAGLKRLKKRKNLDYGQMLKV